jgi:hypothetical protein
MVKSINLQGKEYSTLTLLAQSERFDNVTCALRHFDALQLDVSTLRIEKMLRPHQRLELGLPTTSKKTILYEVSQTTKALRTPKPSVRNREIPSRKYTSYESRRFLY